MCDFEYASRIVTGDRYVFYCCIYRRCSFKSFRCMANSGIALELLCIQQRWQWALGWIGMGGGGVSYTSVQTAHYYPNRVHECL